MSTFVTIDIALTTDDTVDLGVAAPNDTLRMLAKINGKEYRHDYVFNGMGNIIIDNILQNNTAHYLRFFDSSNTLYNDTIYCVTTNDVTLTNKQTNDYLEVVDAVTVATGDDGATTYQNDALINMKRVEVFAKFGTAYQLVNHSGFNAGTGEISFSGDELIGSVDGQTILVKAYFHT